MILYIYVDLMKILLLIIFFKSLLEKQKYRLPSIKKFQICIFYQAHLHVCNYIINKLNN